MGFSKRPNSNENTESYRNRDIHETFKTHEITEKKLVFFKYLNTALNQVKQIKSYYCTAKSNKVEYMYMKYLGSERALLVAFGKI